MLGKYTSFIPRWTLTFVPQVSQCTDFFPQYYLSITEKCLWPEQTSCSRLWGPIAGMYIMLLLCNPRLINISARFLPLMACFQRKTTGASRNYCSCSRLGMLTPSYAYTRTRHWRWWKWLSLISARHWGTLLWKSAHDTRPENFQKKHTHMYHANKSKQAAARGKHRERSMPWRTSGSIWTPSRSIVYQTM